MGKLNRFGYLTTYGVIWHRFAKKTADRLTADYLGNKGEFSIEAEEAFERKLRKNMECKRLGIAA